MNRARQVIAATVVGAMCGGGLTVFAPGPGPGTAAAEGA